MISRSHLKSKIIKISILTTVSFTHTGCFFGYFKNPLVPIEKPRTTYTQPNTTQAVQVTFNTPPPVVECTDDLNSACNKAPVQANELKPKVKTSRGGEVHKLRSIQGKPITVIERPNGFIFPQYKNKIVILKMFGKRCPHCIKEIPTFNKLRKRYGGKVEIIAVQVEDRMSSAESSSLIRRHHIHYPLIAGETATNLQYNIQNTYGWTGILPFTMIIKNGVTEFTYPGTVSYAQISRDLGSVIK